MKITQLLAFILSLILITNVDLPQVKNYMSILVVTHLLLTLGVILTVVFITLVLAACDEPLPKDLKTKLLETKEVEHVAITNWACYILCLLLYNWSNLALLATFDAIGLLLSVAIYRECLEKS